jgi:hypothetical protein
MGIQTNISLKMGVVAIFVTLTFAVAGLTAMTSFTETAVLAQNETGGNMTGGNMTGTANETAIFTPTEEAPTTKR